MTLFNTAMQGTAFGCPGSPIRSAASGSPRQFGCKP